jgi:glucose-1-phosphate thymidylyltransferase
VHAETTSGVWRDTGNVEDMLEANREVLDGIERRVEGKVDPRSTVLGRVRIAEGAVVRGSRIVGPAVIGSGAVISNSSIGPFTSVAEDCRVEDSTVDYSVLLRGARVEGVPRVESSLIGRGAVVVSEPRPVQTHSHRLVIGDHSKVHLPS